MVQLFFELLFLVDLISIVAFSIPSVMMVLVMGPSLFYYARKFYDLPTTNFLWHIIPSQLVICIIHCFIIYEIIDFAQWLYSSYYGLVLFYYFIATIRLIHVHTCKKHQTWTNTIGVGFVILTLLHLIEILLINFNLELSTQIASYNTSIQNIFSFLFFLVVIKQIITDPQPFSNAKVRIPNRYNNAEVNASELKLILSYIEGDKAYQNPELKSTMVSKQTGLLTNAISEIINRAFKKNFNEWINDYRIDEAKKLLLETEMSIKEVYYTVGFNSKSAFNTAFKVRLKETPSSFRKKSSEST